MTTGSFEPATLIPSIAVDLLLESMCCFRMRARRLAAGQSVIFGYSSGKSAAGQVAYSGRSGCAGGFGNIIERGPIGAESKFGWKNGTLSNAYWKG